MVSRASTITVASRLSPGAPSKRDRSDCGGLRPFREQRVSSTLPAPGAKGLKGPESYSPPQERGRPDPGPGARLHKPQVVYTALEVHTEEAGPPPRYSFY